MGKVAWAFCTAGRLRGRRRNEIWGGGGGHGIVENSALLWLSGKGEVGEAVYV